MRVTRTIKLCTKLHKWIYCEYIQWLSTQQSKAQPSEPDPTSTMQRLTPKVHVTNVTLSKGQASVDQATSSNATLTTVTPLSTLLPPPSPQPQQPPRAMPSSMSLIPMGPGRFFDACVPGGCAFSHPLPKWLFTTENHIFLSMDKFWPNFSFILKFAANF